MSGKWKRLLHREIRLPWWLGLAILVGGIAYAIGSHWTESSRRRESWHLKDRNHPSEIEDYQRTQELSPTTLVTLQQGHELLVDHHSADDPIGAVVRNELACIYTLQHNHEAAERLFLESLDSHETYLGPDHEDTQTIRRNLAVLEQFSEP